MTKEPSTAKEPRKLSRTERALLRAFIRADGQPIASAVLLKSLNLTRGSLKVMISNLRGRGALISSTRARLKSVDSNTYTLNPTCLTEGLVEQSRELEHGGT